MSSRCCRTRITLRVHSPRRRYQRPKGVRVCYVSVLHVRLISPPIYIQHKLWPCWCLHKETSLWPQSIRQRCTLQIRQSDLAMQCQPQWTCGQKKRSHLCYKCVLFGTWARQLSDLCIAGWNVPAGTYNYTLGCTTRCQVHGLGLGVDRTGRPVVVSVATLANQLVFVFFDVSTLRAMHALVR